LRTAAVCLPAGQHQAPGGGGEGQEEEEEDGVFELPEAIKLGLGGEGTRRAGRTEARLAGAGGTRSG